MTVWIVWRLYYGGKALVDVFADGAMATRSAEARNLDSEHSRVRYEVSSHEVVPVRTGVQQ